MADSPYCLIQLSNGAYSIHSRVVGETCHPAIGPVAEAEALYLGQLNLLSRLKAHAGEFVVWDVGLGAAANAVTLLRASAHLDCAIRILSFDNSIEPLRFGLENTTQLDYLKGFEPYVETLIARGEVSFKQGPQAVHWQVQIGDFPTLVTHPSASAWPKPHAILFDPYSPAKNPEMWTLPLFSALHPLLDPSRPCAMPTYSRSTMLRVTLLLAGFFVGRGRPAGKKEETTLAANTLDLINEPLNSAWLERIQRSTSAEPLYTARYRQAPLQAQTLQCLQRHPQFSRIN
jgi:hypothetical protein